MVDPVTYEQRKILAEELKELTKDQYEEIFRIIKRNTASYSENSNGIFFDLSTLENETVSMLVDYMHLVKTQRTDEKRRMEDLEYYKHEKEEEKLI